MRYFALASDYDGTLATGGQLAAPVLAALERLKASGRRLVLVTGRQVENLCAECPAHPLFDRIVGENGAVLYRPASHESKLLCETPPPALLARLREQGLDPLVVGRAVIGMLERSRHVVLETIHELGLDWQLSFNRDSLMLLPSGVNKASGLRAALTELGLSPHNAVGVGDAENDHALLGACACAVAVADALPQLKERADLVLSQPNGAGIVELVELLLADDLQHLAPRLSRHDLLIGKVEGQSWRLRASGESLLIAGTSASGKSTLARALLERMDEQRYQYCILDPEGDYAGLETVTALGDATHEPLISAVLDLLEKPEQNAAVNLLGVERARQPEFCASLLAGLQQLRARSGRPHWIVIDEAHHVLPVQSEPVRWTTPQQLKSLVLITVQPESLAPAALGTVNAVVALGEAPAQTLEAIGRALGSPLALARSAALGADEALGWLKGEGMNPFHVHLAPGRTRLLRHARKYAAGELGPDKSFYFRGARGQLNLRAQNLTLFLQLADGVDEETWLYHLQRGDYSRWLREAIKDGALAARVAEVEQLTALPTATSRALVRRAIEERYAV